MPETEYVPAQKPLNVVTYCKVWTDYTGTPVRSILNIHVDSVNEFALSHVQGPMANSDQSTWRQYLRRVATYTCLCFGLANAREVAETSYPFSDMECSREAWGDGTPELLPVSWVYDSHGQYER